MKMMLTTLAALCLSACGGRAADKERQERDYNPRRVVGFETKSGLDTVIVGAQGIAERLATTALTLSFRSNDQGVRYDCQRESELEFTACPTGDIYQFRDLEDGKHYRLQVRAARIDGSAVDETPADLSFNVDLSGGERPFSEKAHERVAQAIDARSVTDIRAKIEDNLPLAISPYYQVLVPRTMVLERLVTRQTTSKTIYVLEALQNGPLGNGESDRCAADWQRPLYFEPYKISYCEGTPTESVWLAAGRSATYDALELAAWNGQEAREQLVFFASYGSEQQSNEIAGSPGFCQNPRGAGRVFVRGIERGRIDYRGGLVPLDWCRVQAQGKIWWTARLDLRLFPEENSPRMVIHYAIAENRAIGDIGSFTRHFQEFVLPRVSATGAK